MISIHANLRRVVRLESRLNHYGYTEPVCWMVLSCGHELGTFATIGNTARVLCPLCARVEP